MSWKVWKMGSFGSHDGCYSNDISISLMMGCLFHLRLLLVIVFNELGVASAHVLHNFWRSHNVHELVVQQYFLPHILAHSDHFDCLADAQDTFRSWILAVGD